VLADPVSVTVAHLGDPDAALIVSQYRTLHVAPPLAHVPLLIVVLPAKTPVLELIVNRALSVPPESVHASAAQEPVRELLALPTAGLLPKVKVLLLRETLLIVHPPPPEVDATTPIPMAASTLLLGSANASRRARILIMGATPAQSSH
jgi:hypothetical protein